MSWSQKDDADLLDAVEEFATAASGTVDPHTSQASIIAWSNVARRLGRGLTDKMCEIATKESCGQKTTHEHCFYEWIHNTLLLMICKF
jgi:hypothetical protein